MEWVRLVFDFIGTMAWPLAVAGLVGFFFVQFKENVARVIDRIQRVQGPIGTGFDTGPLPGGQSPSDPSAGGVEADPLAGEMQDLATRFPGVIANLNRTAPNASQQEKAYRAVYALYQFERIYRVMYGTQLTFMLTLLGVPSLPEISLTPTFDEHVKRTVGVVNYTPTREAFVSYLLRSEMVTHDEQARTYQITEWGNEFLSYIANQGLSHMKPY